MPPKFAALICVGFILWLFRRLSRQGFPMSAGLWIVFLWITILASRPVGYWLATGDVASTIAAAFASDSQGSFIDRNTYLFLIILGILVLARRRADWPAILHQTRWLWLFYAYLLLSVTWSDYPFIAFKRWFKDVGNVVIILVILTEEDPLKAVRAVFTRCAYVLVLVSVLFMKYFPDLGRYYNTWTWTSHYCGVTLSKNALAEAAMISGFFLLWNIVDWEGYRWGRAGFRKVWPDLLVLALCLRILAVAECATDLACFVLGAAVFFGARLAWVKTHRPLFVCGGLGIALLMIAFTVFPGFRGAIAGLLGRDVTLTGRTLIWEQAVDLGTNPLIGSGFASTWLTKKGVEMADELGGLSHAHNGYLETYLHSGWIGVCLLLLVLVVAGRKAAGFLVENHIAGYLFVVLFVSGLFHNYTEVAFNTGNIIGFTLWLIAAHPYVSSFGPVASEIIGTECSPDAGVRSAA